MDNNNTTAGPRRPMYDQDSPQGARRQVQRAARQDREPQAEVYRRQASPRGGQQPPRKKKRRRKSHWLRNTLIILLLVVMVAVAAVWAKVNQVVNQMDGEQTEAGVLPEDIKTLPEYTGKGIVNFLVCGIDYDNEDADGYTTDDKIGRTDMILYVHYDTLNNKCNILQIPRDTYVGTEVQTGYTYQINGLYYFSDDTDNRMAALAQVLYDQYKLTTDFYVTIDMDAVKEIIDIKGSIEVYVPMDVTDPDYGVTLEAGWRGFSGAEAEFFLRNRTSPNYKDQGDIMRLQMQQSFYSALFREFKTLEPWDLVMWMNVLTYRIKTDNTDLIQLGGLAQKALKLQSEDIVFVRPSMGGAVYGKSVLLTMLPEHMAEILNTYFRPEGESYGADELNIPELQVVESMGIYDPSIRSMGDIQADEPEK